jgi:hypothetical protein
VNPHELGELNQPGKVASLYGLNSGFSKKLNFIYQQASVQDL